MHPSSDLSFPLEQFQHLPNPYYPHDALRDSLVRTNIVNLDLASPPPPQRTNPRSHPLTPPDTPGVRRNTAIHVHYDEKDEKPDDLGGQDLGLKRSTLDRFLALGLLVNTKRNPTRYLVVGGVPPDAPTHILSRVFCRMGALKGMFVRYQKQGIVVLSWHDLRDAKKALTLITTNALFNMDELLSAAFITPSNLIKSTGQSLFVDPKEGNITITAEQPAIPATDGERKPASSNQDGDQKHQEHQQQQQQQPISLHAALALFGELSTFSVNESVGSTTYFASYHDAREAANAAKSLHGRSILGMHIRVAEGFPQDTASDNQGQALAHQPPQKEGTQKLGQSQSQLLPPHHHHHHHHPRSPAATPEKKQFSGSRSERTPPSPLHTQSSNSDSDDAAGTPHAPTNSPVAKLPPSLPPSSSLNVRPTSKPTSRSGPSRTPPNVKLPINVNVPIYSTPPLGPSPRLRTTSGGNLMMRSGSPTTTTLSPSSHLLNRAVPPRLALPWLQGSMPGGQLQYEDGGSTAMQFNGGGNGPLRQHLPTPLPLPLGPGAYIRGLDNTPQSAVHRGPYAYNSPQNFGPASGVGHRFPSSNNNVAPGSANDDGPTSSAHSHHPSPHSRKHTLSTSTSTSASISTSTGTGPSTIDSTGPPTPLHAYGRSPALSARTSFDHGHIRGGGGGHHPHPHPHPHPGAGAQDLRVQVEAVEVVERKDGNLGDNDGATSGPAVVPMRPQYNGGGGGGGGYHGHAAPERNGVDVGRIEAGLDTRTTVMLKNVPNKMSDADLRKYISDVVPNSFDFVYLRFDFNSSANVGYAFVNFVNAADLLSFAKARLGVKWNMFCSEKVLQMSYANFQGKEALVEKFKNSCVMEMQDEWVPKIFHSSGPNKGQREPFPPATNPSRARRSQDQRERGLLRGSGLFVGGRGHLSFKHGQ